MGKNYIEKVAIVGASGTVGKFIAAALLKTGKHTVTAITREESSSTFAPGVVTRKVNYAEPSSLVSALQGQDCLIITMGTMAPPDQQTKLIDAAAAAGVPWVLPNEFGGDPLDIEKGKDNFIGARKRVYRDQIEELGKSSWVALVSGFWYQYSLAGSAFRYGFDFKEKTVVFFGEGDVKINTSTWEQSGLAVAKLLSLKVEPDSEDDKSPTLASFKNKPLYISSFTVSQQDMLESVLRVTGASASDWKVTKVPVKEYYQAGVDEFKRGNRVGFAKALYGREFSPESDGNFGAKRGLHNDILGLPKEDLDAATKDAVEMAEKGVEW